MSKQTVTTMSFGDSHAKLATINTFQLTDTKSNQISQKMRSYYSCLLKELENNKFSNKEIANDTGCKVF